MFYREKYEYRMINEMLHEVAFAILQSMNVVCSLFELKCVCTIKVIHLVTPSFTYRFVQLVGSLYNDQFLFFLLIFFHSYDLKFGHVFSRIPTSLCSHQSQLSTDSIQCLHANWLSHLTLYAANVFEKFYLCKVSCHFWTFKNWQSSQVKWKYH